MKVEATRVETSNHGAIESQAFSIKTSASSVAILSDKLYSDKKLAILRELGANAYDAHIMAGTTDIPIDVKLPNMIDAEFRVRDYGTGMSHDNVMHLYSTYFESTKSDSNDQIGALGLGSKTPFCYSDAFSVISIFEGEKRTYNINIGPNGIPVVTLMPAGFEDGDRSKPIHFTATDEHDGLSVSFAVKEADFDEFERKARTVFRLYDPQPNFLGVDDTFEADVHSYEYAGEGWKLRNSSYGNTVATMGLIEYPVSYNKLVGVEQDDRNLISNLPLELAFGIGELDIAASREELGYDERTSANIVRKARAALAELLVLVQEDFEKCETMWDASILYNTTHTNTNLGSALRRSNVELEWKDQKIESRVEIEFGPTYDRGNDTYTNTLLDGMVISQIHMATARGWNNPKRVRQEKHYACSDYSKNHLRITPASNVEFIIDDDARGTLRKVKYYVEENYSSSDNKTVYFIQSSTAANRKQLAALLGFKESMYRAADTLPEVPKKPKVVNTDPIKMWKMDTALVIRDRRYDYSFTFGKCFDSASVEYDLGGIYIPTLRKTPVTKDTCANDSLEEEYGFCNTIKAAIALGVITEDTRVYAVSHGNVAKLKKEGEWDCLFDLVKAKLDDTLTDPAFNQTIAQAHLSSNAWNTIRDDVSFVRSNEDMIEQSIAMLAEALTFTDKRFEEFATFATLRNTPLPVKYADVDMGNIEKVMAYFGVKQGDTLLDTSASELVRNIVTAYPMLEILFSDVDTVEDRFSSQTRPDADRLVKFVNYVELIHKADTESA